MVISGCEGVWIQEMMSLAQQWPHPTAHTSDGQALTSGGLAAGLPHLGLSVSLHLDVLLSSSCLSSLPSVCAPGCCAGHSGGFLPSGVPRWVQMPEGVIYATITLGTACSPSWNASDSCLLPGSQRCVCAPRVATAFFLSSCMGPARACSVQSSRGATYPAFHSPTPTALNVLSKHMAKRPTVCVAVLPSVPQDIVR